MDCGHTCTIASTAKPTAHTRISASALSAVFISRLKLFPELCSLAFVVLLVQHASSCWRLGYFTVGALGLR